MAREKIKQQLRIYSFKGIGVSFLLISDHSDLVIRKTYRLRSTTLMYRTEGAKDCMVFGLGMAWPRIDI